MFRSRLPVLIAAVWCALSAGAVSAQTPLPVALPTISGTVVDPTGAALAGAVVRITSRDATTLATVYTDAAGAFTVTIPDGSAQISIAAAGFLDRHTPLARLEGPRPTFTLGVAGIHEAVNVEGGNGYGIPQAPSAMRTPTPLRDVPQAVSIVTRDLIADQGMQGIGDVVRYMPGVGIAQGEGNRDTPVLRGQSTTADFFVDGVRDDVQYVRDLYNVERVEALKGPNAMIFGRGGAGGVINRVTRQADWARQTELTLQIGSWDQKRLAADTGWSFSPAVASRVTGVYEDSGSYRDGAGVKRYGVNPTAAWRLAPRTFVRAGYEYFHDERTADRGVSSLDGAPLETAPSLFFGDPSRSPVRATLNVATASLEHVFVRGGSLRTRLSAGAYDKFYQNVFPGAANGTAQTVQISAYNLATDRQNIFSQTDVIVPGRTGALVHTLLVGAELGRQVTDNFRSTGYFTGLGPGVTSVSAPLDRPTINLPVDFRQSATDADNHGLATTVAVYAQDQIRLARAFEVVAGVRVERFEMELTDNRTGTTLTSSDTLFSPRAGLIYKPVADLSIYTSYSRSYIPRAGEQLSSLTATAQALEPEVFRNYEVGAKWDAAASLALTLAMYRLDRGNVAIADPHDPARSLLVDGQRAHGLEIGWTGAVTPKWAIAGGYAWQEGEITRSLSSSAEAGASLAQLPRHSVSLWNRYQIVPRASAAVGIVHRGDAFTSTDNRVVLPAFTRVDAGLFVNVTTHLRAQVNVENVLDARYFASAHSNTNITPGRPRALRVALIVRP